MQKKCSPTSCRFILYLLTLCLLAVAETRAQTPLEFPAGTLSYGDNQALALRLNCYPDHIDFEPVAIEPDQALVIILQFSPVAAGTSILVGLESSGEITTPTNDGAVTIGNDGTVSIGFRAPHEPGNCPMQFRFGSSPALLPLFVMNPGQEQNSMHCQKTITVKGGRR